MTTMTKLKSSKLLIALLFSLLYIVWFTIPNSYGRQIWSNLLFKSDIVNNLVCHEATELELKRDWKFPEEEEADSEPQGIFQYQNISDCRCSRKWRYPPTTDRGETGSNFKRLNSSCSDEGTHYQTNQNVISFSLFYPQKTSKFMSLLNFQLGLRQNLLQMREHYPGYSIRVYTNIPLCLNEYFCTLLCENEDVFWCDITKTPSHGNLSWTDFRTWRFLTMGDPTVNIFHSRDLDSLIGHREGAAAQDWVSNSEKAIMIMRDHIGGHNIEMLGGMWGADNRRLLEDGDKLRQQLILKSMPTKSHGYGLDQTFIASVIFYPMAKNILAYDSYHCVRWSNFTEVRPFPTRQTEPGRGFVGNYIKFSENGTDNERKIYDICECPLNCRPSYGLDWIYC